jgi:hypothetical protein
VTWTTPAGLRGNPRVIRLSASQLDRGNHHFRAFAAVKARPQLWPNGSEPRRYAPWESLPLGVVTAALDLVEFQGLEIDVSVMQALSQHRSPLHEGAGIWVRHACRRYVESAMWLDDELVSDGITLCPKPKPQVVQASSAAEHPMLTAWGRWYSSADGRGQEFRRLRLSRAGTDAEPSTLAFAFVAATGLRAKSDIYRDVPVAVEVVDVPPERLRVVEVVLKSDVVSCWL